ncbi:methyltransferase domain-containing protein [Gammaproteobacteria bacterium]|nr:methyltransferase domain-containing protein [Gammaproteobacteria bacterium]
MDEDDQTIAAYDEQAQAYDDFVSVLPPDPLLMRFIETFAPGDHVLDLGCGPGLDAAMMAGKGLRVDAIDASSQMVSLANQRAGVSARQARFEQITGDRVYDGIWANFSLLHADPKSLPTILASLNQALKLGCLFHLAMKLGNGRSPDKLGRIYSYFSEAELRSRLTAAGFEVKSTVRGESLGLSGSLSPWIALSCVRLT